MKKSFLLFLAGSFFLFVASLASSLSHSASVPSTQGDDIEKALISIVEARTGLECESRQQIPNCRDLTTAPGFGTPFCSLYRGTFCKKPGEKKSALIIDTGYDQIGVYGNFLISSVDFTVTRAARRAGLEILGLDSTLAAELTSRLRSRSLVCTDVETERAYCFPSVLSGGGCRKRQSSVCESVGRRLDVDFILRAKADLRARPSGDYRLQTIYFSH